MNVDQLTPDKMEMVFAENYPLLQNYCKYLGMNKWEREDIVQETFLKALEKYEEKVITTALLKKMVYNQWIDEIRKNKKWQLDQPDKKESNKKEIDTLMMLAEHLVNQLTTKQGIVYLLSEGFSYSLKEVAEVIGSSEGAVKSILFRARTNLKQKSFIQEEKVREVEVETFRIFYDVLKKGDPSLLLEEIRSNHICLQTAPAKQKNMKVRSWYSGLSMAA
ncbi:sigma-70 family RNA polymerase sigma factor [Niallia sp. 01092]|uniref:sigma-70 family RNA polymerase sigma factor n=1 Tax=unclassified Niallia TaxID=2837522 RepID=UPI003FD496EF